MDCDLLTAHCMAASNQLVGNKGFRDFPPDSVLFGKSEVMQKLRSKLLRVCSTTVPVLLQGEVGVGKSVLSCFIHSHSASALGPYVSINCAALGGWASDADAFLPLHGALGVFHVQGDDASATFRGGTLFLEQVSELTPQLQVQLACSLTESDDCTTRKRHDVREKLRIVSSSTRNLRHDVRLGHFRRDLFHRLVVVAIDVPPLRDHLEDLPRIAEYLRLHHSAQLAVTDPPFSQELLSRMLAYRWPGNIRELENVICRYVVLGGGECGLCDRSTAIRSNFDCADSDRVQGSRKRSWRR